MKLLLKLIKVFSHGINKDPLRVFLETLSQIFNVLLRKACLVLTRFNDEAFLHNRSRHVFR